MALEELNNQMSGLDRMEEFISLCVIVFDTEADGGIRLVSSRLSSDHVIVAVDAESGLNQNEKCELFHDLFSGSSDWSAERYRGIGRRGCAEYPRE